jgi:HEAT repeat protein
MRDEDDDVRKQAIDVLGALGPMAIPTLIRALKNHDLYVRLGAVKALAKNRPLAPSVAQALIASATTDKSYAVKETAAGSCKTLV